ncbi:hypothetical protein BD289DRAFT_437180 [Coniella lustricola]|uniref:Uncharacterized protein n=1 Tax=Coniella lustricola TaxID=2025994 RepID=A0A2T3A445_9PEZI|nr:hypothetical protein BD289DRAFT_437180 [Coniella lustricola]
MSPSEFQTIDLPAITVNGQAMPAEPESVHARQPDAMQPMDPARPHQDKPTELRGGERSQMCPGRFCFIIPCPLPCDFCIC